MDFNPVKGAKRPKVESNEGKTSALGDHRARVLLDAPDPTTLKGKRDRALLSVLLYHGLRREELCQLKVRDIHARRGVLHLRIHGKGNKLRYLPLHAGSAERIHAYLEVAGHGEIPNAPLFQPARRKNSIGVDRRWRLQDRARVCSYRTRHTGFWCAQSSCNSGDKRARA
ncbi:tyrosine-type recombinase/integrase [Caballeronia sp. DA-9]|uniref:tyrosine-type recombinase/integrase n=1 Tax=Caballeronia sp. DA-9 TaxID=3436237 RepID=UPI003F66D4FA